LLGRAGSAGQPNSRQARAESKKKWADSWVPPVGDPLETKRYPATSAVGLKGDPTVGSLSSFLSEHEAGNPSLGTGSGWGWPGTHRRAAAVDGEAAAGSQEVGEASGGGSSLGASASSGQLGDLVRRRRSQARSNGDASGELCAGKRFVGVSRG
jgi:hypothetical protein